MKKMIAAIVSLAVVLGLLMGCSSAPEASTTAAGTIIPSGSDLTAEEIFDNFEDWLANSEMANAYSTTRLPATQLPETGRSYQTLVITDSMQGYNYHLSIYSTPEGYAYRAGLTHTNNGYGYLAFSTFCLFLVRSLGLTDVDGQELSDTLGLMTAEPEGEVIVEDWELWAFNTNNLLSFTATHEAE